MRVNDVAIFAFIRFGDILFPISRNKEIFDHFKSSLIVIIINYYSSIDGELWLENAWLENKLFYGVSYMCRR